MDIIQDTFQDTYLTIPILFITYLLLEYFEHIQYKKSIIRFGPLLGASIGMIPQCGFSVFASLLFVEKRISLGTLISVFIATSDEAIPILIAYPNQYKCLIRLIVLKFIVAIVIGYIIDFIFPISDNNINSRIEYSHSCSPIKEALIRTFKTYSFIFVTSLILSLIIEGIGTKNLSLLFFKQSLVQPILSALFGFIPNCASSVILTQLHINGFLSFASLLSGLMTNAGLGLMALIHYRVEIQTLFKISFILFISSLIFTIPLQWFSL